MDIRYHTPLTPDEMARFGCREPWTYGMADKVHFHELDSLNHVNNVVYFSWFETIRVRYMMDWGISDYKTGSDNPRLVVKSVSADYRSEMHKDEDYLVVARTKEYRRNSFTMEYALWCGDLRATGEAVVVLLEADGSAKRPLTEAVKKRFAEIDGAVLRA